MTHVNEVVFDCFDALIHRHKEQIKYHKEKIEEIEKIKSKFFDML